LQDVGTVVHRSHKFAPGKRQSFGLVVWSGQIVSSLLQFLARGSAWSEKLDKNNITFIPQITTRRRLQKGLRMSPPFTPLSAKKRCQWAPCNDVKRCAEMFSCTSPVAQAHPGPNAEVVGTHLQIAQTGVCVDAERGDKQEAASGSLSNFFRLTVPFQNLCWHEISTATQHHPIIVKQMLSITLGCLQAHQPLWGTAMSLCKHYQGLEGPVEPLKFAI